jgi:hypothetical protein
MAERVCPFNGGLHRRLVTRWGQSCRFCHRTWEWRDKRLVATWPDD